MLRYESDFPTLIRGFDFQTLENEPNVIFGLSSELTLNYFNPAWFKFAGENNGEPQISEQFVIGTHISKAISKPLQEYYLFTFKSLLERGVVWHHDYDCSSADTYRLCRQTIYPMHHLEGLIVVNNLTVERPFTPDIRKPYPPDEELYTNRYGNIIQCANCRRIQRVRSPDIWDWIPAWVDDIPINIGQSMCPICEDYYFKHSR